MGAILKDFYKPNLHAKSINYGDFIQNDQRSLLVGYDHQKWAESIASKWSSPPTWVTPGIQIENVDLNIVGNVQTEDTLPETNSKSTWKWMVGRLNFLLGWPIFRGELLVSGRIFSKKFFVICLYPLVTGIQNHIETWVYMWEKNIYSTVTWWSNPLAKQPEHHPSPLIGPTCLGRFAGSCDATLRRLEREIAWHSAVSLDLGVQNTRPGVAYR